MNESRELLPTAKDSYTSVSLMTPEGEMSFRYYKVQGAHQAVIWVSGTEGGWSTPARDLYPALCDQLKCIGIASLRIRFRQPQSLKQNIRDVLSAIEYLKDDGIDEFALVGHGQGGIAVIQAAKEIPAGIRTLVVLSCTNFQSDPTELVGPNCSILLIHGADDNAQSLNHVQKLYQMAPEPKQLLIYENAGRNLDESASKIHRAIYEWLRSELA